MYQSTQFAFFWTENAKKPDIFMFLRCSNLCNDFGFIYVHMLKIFEWSVISTKIRKIFWEDLRNALRLKNLSNIVRTPCIFDAFNISLRNDFDYDTDFMRENILIGSTLQLSFANESFGPSKQKWYNLMLVEWEDMCYRFTIVLLLSQPEAMRKIDPDSS